MFDYPEYRHAPSGGLLGSSPLCGVKGRPATRNQSVTCPDCLRRLESRRIILASAKARAAQRKSLRKNPRPVKPSSDKG